jgi:hypothetical protein
MQLSVALKEIQSDGIDVEFAEAIQEIDGERKCARIKVEKRGKTRAALTIKEAVALIILNRYRSNLERIYMEHK